MRLTICQPHYNSRKERHVKAREACTARQKYTLLRIRRAKLRVGELEDGEWARQQASSNCHQYHNETDPSKDHH